MNYAKKLNLHWFCTQNHILEPFSVRCACTKSYVTSEPYPRASQIWCQNVRETRKKKVIKCRGESFARCRVIARNVEGGLKGFLGLRLVLTPSQVNENSDDDDDDDDDDEDDNEDDDDNEEDINEHLLDA